MSANPALVHSADAAPRLVETRPWVILSIDDDELVHMVTRRALRDLYFEGRPMHVFAAESATEAREKLARRPYVDLILLDVAMESPESGLDLLRELRQDPRYRHTRVVLRTGKRGLVAPIEMVTRYVIDGYYSKGDLSLDALQLLVVTSLRTARMFQELERSHEALAEARQRAESASSLPHLERPAGGVALPAPGY